MVNPMYVADKNGRVTKKLPDVKIGNERLNSSHPTSRLSSDKLVVCEEHGSVRRTYVKWNGGPCAVCHKCIEQHCKVTTSMPYMPPLDYDTTGEVEHPHGHSY